MSQRSNVYKSPHKIKSKYLGLWDERTVTIKLPQNEIEIEGKSEKRKVFPLTKTEVSKNSNWIQLRVEGGRNYEISDKNSQQLHQIITNSKDLYNFCNFEESNQVMFPKSLDYNSIIGNPQIKQFLNPKHEEEVSVSDHPYPRQHSYLIQSDWEINQKDGGLRLISNEKKGNQAKIVKFVVKKFLTTRSLMGISYPVFAMKPESILQTYAKGLGAAPLFFSKISTDPVERIKNFVCFIFSCSRIMADMDKPFNPTIGETFQAQIADCHYSAQQTSHHPPQSSFYLEGPDFKLYGTLQMVASIGINSATGRFEGDFTVQFEDGGKVLGRLPVGEMRGFILGENLFSAASSAYAYDPINQIVCTYKIHKKDIFTGFVGKLKEKYMTKFVKQMQSTTRFESFEVYKEKQFEEVLSKLEATWSKKVVFDEKVYLDFEQEKYMPYLPTKVSKNMLLSDSRHRQDLRLRENGQIDEAQTEKERIEEQQRYFRKLRENRQK